MSSPIDLPGISLNDLDAVTGGATTSSSTASDAQVSAALQGITASLANLKSQNSGGSSISQLLPLMLIAKGGTGGACPCGCGMANCMRR
jgi:hypothetical protein